MTAVAVLICQHHHGVGAGNKVGVAPLHFCGTAVVNLNRRAGGILIRVFQIRGGHIVNGLLPVRLILIIHIINAVCGIVHDIRINRGVTIGILIQQLRRAVMGHIHQIVRKHIINLLFRTAGKAGGGQREIHHILAGGIVPNHLRRPKAMNGFIGRQSRSAVCILHILNGDMRLVGPIYQIRRTPHGHSVVHIPPAEGSVHIRCYHIVVAVLTTEQIRVTGTAGAGSLLYNRLVAVDGSKVVAVIRNSKANLLFTGIVAGKIGKNILTAGRSCRGGGRSSKRQSSKASERHQHCKENCNQPFAG